MTKLQVALDCDLQSALKILTRVHPYIDIVEIGTPLIIREGMNAVRQVRKEYPNLTLLADLKIMDAGEEEASIAFEAGADIVTVLGVTNEATMTGAVQSASKCQGQIMVDMMQVNHPVEHGKQFIQMGCDILCVHTAYDLQSSHDSPYYELEQLREHLRSAKLAIASGVDNTKLDEIIQYRPEIIIVGGAITRSDNHTQSAQKLYERIHKHAD